MHCPDCGQQQINDEIRFCSRCGFPLALVSKVVSNRGTLPELSELSENKSFFSRKAGIFTGIVWILFFVLVATTFLEIMHAPGELISMAAIFGIFSGVLIILASVFFLGGGRVDENTKTSPGSLNSRQPGALPPQQTTPAQSFIPPKKSKWETNDLGPPSVTEGTTKLLKEEE
jgi:hypothetical protein